MVQRQFCSNSARKNKECRSFDRRLREKGFGMSDGHASGVCSMPEGEIVYPIRVMTFLPQKGYSYNEVRL